jgi:hypothetical protein
MSRRKRPSNTLHTQIGPYAMVPLWVLERCREARAIQLYALLLAKWANRDGRCWPDRKDEVVPAMGCSLRNVDRAIATLKDIGALETKLKHRTNGAVAGMDYFLIQVDPRLTATSGRKEESDQNATAGEKAGAILPATGGEKVFDQNATGDSLTATGGIHLKEEPDPDNQIQEHVSTAAPPTHRHDAGPTPESVATRSLLDDYHDGYLARFNKKPTIVGGKDGKLLKDLADQVGEAAVRHMLLEAPGQPGWFFRTPDPFINTTGYTVGVFFSVFSKLQLTEQPARTAAAVEARIAMMAEMRSRSDNRQSDLEQQARAALVAATPEARDRIRRGVIADLQAAYPGIDQRMDPDAFARSVKSAIVRYVVDHARRDNATPADVLAAYTGKVTAA